MKNKKLSEQYLTTNMSRSIIKKKELSWKQGVIALRANPEKSLQIKLICKFENIKKTQPHAT